MRMLFHTLTRPKHLAQRLQVVFPALSHMQAQDWAAQILGYRNWHELRGCVGPDVQETPDFVISLEEFSNGQATDESRAFFKRATEQHNVLKRLIGYPVAGMPSLFFHIDPNYPDVRYKKLGKTGKGTPPFAGLAYDLYEREGEGPGVGGGSGPDIGETANGTVCTYLGIPEGEEESAFLQKFARTMRKATLPFKNYDRLLLESLSGHSFGLTSFGTEPLEGVDDDGHDRQAAWQQRRYRFFILEDDQPVGAAVLLIDASASSGRNSATVTVTVDEAWSLFEADEVLESLALQMAQEICEPIQRLSWFRVSNADMNVEVNLISESESQLTWYLAEELTSLIPSLLADEMDESELSAISFSCSVCP